MSKNQHYVSQFYLRAWSNDGNKIFTAHDDKVEQKSIRSVASSDYFYKIEGMNNKTRDFLLEQIRTLPPFHMKGW